MTTDSTFDEPSGDGAHGIPVTGAARSASTAGPRPDLRAPSAAGKRLVVLLSGGGSILAALLDAHRDPAFGARVVAVVADTPEAGGLERARAAGVATAVVSPRDFPDRPAWDAALAEAVDVFRPDVVLSAGFMRILGPTFLDRFPDRVLNTHPALLPAFPGAHAVRDALAAGATVTGCTVHVVDAGVDTGPVIAQERVVVQAGDDEASLHERIKVVERTLVVDVVGRVVREGLIVRDGAARIGREG